MTLTAGVRLGAYEVVSLLGAGGMGEVYLAHDPRLGRDVAIKLLPAAFAGDATRLARFNREARAIAALSHPNIVTVHDIGQGEDGTPFIVMEYVRGETLAAQLASRRFSCRQALQIGSAIADAVAAAHRGAVVHRDLKPANVILTTGDRVKVLDFGLAKTVEIDANAPTVSDAVAAAGNTRPHQVLGTPGYMSPEQLLGELVDYRTDIYSLGVMLFELVTGRRPFLGDSLAMPRHTALTAPVQTASELDPSVPAAVSDLISRAMARSPSDRPRSVEAVRDELESLSETLGRDGESAEQGLSLRRKMQRRRVVRYAAYTFAALVAIGGGALVRWRSPTPLAERPVIAVLPMTNLTGDVQNAYVGVGLVDALTSSLGSLSSIAVVPRSTMRETAALATTDLARIARSVGATLLLQGSWQQSGTRVRVHAQLVTPESRVVWSGDSEAELSDIFALQNRLAGSLIDALLVNSDSERPRLTRAPTESREALDAYWQGLALLDRSDEASLDRATASLEQAIARDPRFSLAHAALGEALRRKSSRNNDSPLMKRAVDEVSEALRLDPDQPDVRLSLASVFNATGRRGAAIDELRRAIAQQPLNDDAHRELGEVLANEGRHDEALAELKRAVGLRPHYWRNLESLGIFQYQNGQLKDAVDVFTRLTEIRPDDGDPYQQLGTAYQALGNRVQARRNYERSIQLNPNASSYTNLGTIHYAERRYVEAAQAYAAAVRLSPKRASLHRNLGDAYLKLGRTAEARAEYNKAVELGQESLAVNPDDPTRMSQLAVYEAKLGRRPEALRHADAATAINPVGPDILYRRAVVLALNGDREGAVKGLTEAISRGYSKQLALEDDDLASLRSLPAVQSLLGSR